jgi:hypothetical protein
MVVRGRMSLVAASLLASCLPVVAAEERRAIDAGDLVPATFGGWQCTRGVSWRCDQTGSVRVGFWQIGLLLVNGTQVPRAQAPRMTADGREYVLAAAVGRVNVTRRVRFDAERSAVRYVEVLENKGPSAESVQITVAMTGPRAGRPAFALGSGDAFGGSLGRDDIGVVVAAPQGTAAGERYSHILLVLAEQRLKDAPAISARSDDVLQVTYTETVAPGGSVAIVYFVAGRKELEPFAACAAAKEFHDGRTLVAPEIPRELRAAVRNFPSVARAALEERVPALPFEALAERSGIARGADDTATLGRATRVAGKVACASLCVTTAHGVAELSLDAVAAIVGGAGEGRPMRVYLRNGEILCGPVDARDLIVRTRGGVEVPLAPAAFDALLMHASADDGVLPAPSTAFVTTCRGDRLALKPEGNVDLEVATAWGPFAARLRPGDGLAMETGTRPGLRLSLADGTRLSVCIAREALALSTHRFGEITLAPALLREIVWARSVPTRSDPQGAARAVAESDRPAEAPPGAGDDERSRALGARVVRCRIDDKPLTEAVELVCALAGASAKFELAILHAAAATTVRGDYGGVPLRDVLRDFARQAELRVEFHDGAAWFGAAARQEPPVEKTAPEPPAVAEAAVPPRWNLAGDNALVGNFADAELRIVTEAGPAVLTTRDLVAFEREDADGAQARPAFRFELADGTALHGRFEAPVLAVACAGGIMRVAVADVASWQSTWVR